MEQDSLERIIDEAVAFVCMNPAGMAVHRLNTPFPRLPAEHVGLSAAVQGDYRLVLHLLLGMELYEQIAANMIHGGTFGPDDRTDCLREFFNILCGRIVSLYNRRANVSARFQVPSEIPPEKLAELCNGGLRSICYSSGYGELQLMYLFQLSGVTAPEPVEGNRKGVA